MTSFYLVTGESPPIDLDVALERVEAGVRELLGKQDVEVKISNNGVFWNLGRRVKFIARVSRSEVVSLEAADLAAFASDADQPHIRNAATRFVCHDHGGTEKSSAEFFYFLSLLAAGHESWCFRIDDRQYVSCEFDEKGLFDKERLPVGLSVEATHARRKLTRVFGEPLPVDAADETEFSKRASEIPTEILSSFVRGLEHYGYSEAKPDEAGRTFDYAKNSSWRLQVRVTPTEIYFTVPRSRNTGQGTAFEVYQTCSEIVGDLPLRIYDAINDEWFDR